MQSIMVEAETHNQAAIYGDEEDSNLSHTNILQVDGGELLQEPPQEDVQQLTASTKNSKQPPKHRNINSYYGHKIGFYQTLSLLLNAGLMIYAHLGLSAVIYSSRDPSITALLDSTSSALDDGAATNNDNGENGDNSTETAETCNEQDVQIWIQSGGESTRPTQSNYCSRTYIDSSSSSYCLATPSCISECFQSTYKYSQSCSNCFASIPTCSIRNMCTFLCAANSFSTECQECNAPCVEEFKLCTGLPEEVEEESGNNATAPTVLPSSTQNNNNNQDTSCNTYDLSKINQWYTAYELTFVKSIKDAWNGDAQLLAVIIVLFSGIWPYAKNIILVIVWYTPMSRKRQKEILLWLSRLSKYTLVDVFAVIGVLVGVQLQLNVGGTDAVIRAEPRFGIIVSR